MFKRLIDWVTPVDIRILTIAPIFVAGICFYAVTLIAPKYVGNPVQDLLVSIGFLCSALSPIMIMLKKEFYVGPIRVEGMVPFFLGLLFTILMIGLAFLPIIVWLTGR